VTDELDLYFHAPDPKVIIEKGIKDDVDRILNEVGSAAASLDGSDQEVLSEKPVILSEYLT
jgi:hypothetical protein